MEQRRNLCSPDAPSVITTSRHGEPIANDPLNVNVERTLPVEKNKRPEPPRQIQIRLQRRSMSAQGVAPLEIPAQVARAKQDVEGLAFDAYDEAVNDYVERVYSEWLTSPTANAPR